MAEINNTNNNVPAGYYDSQRRFEEAKNRYKESLSTGINENNSDDMLLKYLKSQQNNQNNIQQNIPLPLPVEFNDTNLAHNNALIEIYKQLELMNNNEQKYYEKSTGLLESIGEGWSDGLDTFTTDNNNQKGWFTKLTGNLLGVFKDQEKQNMAKRMEQLLSPINQHTNDTTRILDKIFTSGLLVYGKNDSSGVMQARNSFIETKQDPGAFGGFGSLFTEGDGFMAKTMEGIGNVVSFFKSTGDKLAGDMKDRQLTDFMGGLTGKSGVMGIVFNGLIRIASIFGGLGSFFGLILGAGVIASMYAMFKHPEQLFGMFKALTTLFTDVIQPAFEWLMKEIFPPLSIAFAGIIYYGEKLLDIVGTVINKTLIYFIGTALPAIFKQFGIMINTAWQIIKDTFSGLFTYFSDIYDAFNDKGVIAGILQIFAGFPKLLFGVVKSLFVNLGNMVVSMFGNAMSFFKGTDEQSGGLLSGIVNGIINFFTDTLPNFIKSSLKGLINLLWDVNPINLIFKAIDYFFGTSLSDFFTKNLNNIIDTLMEIDPLKFIVKKVLGFFDYILGFIPGWDTLKGFLKSLIPDWLPDRIKNWFTDALEGSGDNVPTPDGGTVNQQEVRKKTLSETADQAYESIKKKTNESIIEPVRRNSSDIINNANESIIEPVRRNSSEIYDSLKERSRDISNTIVNAPKNIINNNNNVTNNSSAGYGRASSGSDMSPMDSYLYGI